MMFLAVRTKLTGNPRVLIRVDDIQTMGEESDGITIINMCNGTHIPVAHSFDLVVEAIADGDAKGATVTTVKGVLPDLEPK